MDEVYRNNYELRKEVRMLQKTVKELSNKLNATISTTAATSNTAGSATPIAAAKTVEVNGSDNKGAKPATTTVPPKK
jgi:hypothetical protein